MNDSALLKQVSDEPGFGWQRVLSFVAASCTIGKLIYAVFFCRQAIEWAKEKNTAKKMATMYLVAIDYLEKAGIPRRLLDIAEEMFGKINGKPIKPTLRRSMQFISVPWHARMARTFNLLIEEFKNGMKVVSYGCGCGIIEILAAIASDNKVFSLTLVDIDSDGLRLASDLIELFYKHGYDIRDNVNFQTADVHKHNLPEGTDVVASIGCLYNYSNALSAGICTEEWLRLGVKKAITDIYFNPDDCASRDAKLRIRFIHSVLGWPIGQPNGLLFCSESEFHESLPTRRITSYDHGENATMVVWK